MNDTSLPAKTICVKAFEATSMKSVENEVNTWIAENPTVMVVDISFQKGTEDSSAVIVHRQLKTSTDQPASPIS